jgi:hypothetical protein
MLALPLVEQMALRAARDSLVVTATGVVVACSGKHREEGDSQGGENVAEELHDDA